MRSSPTSRAAAYGRRRSCAFRFSTAADKFAIARALVALTLAQQRDTGESFQQWLDQYGQTKNAVARFWHPILVSALSEELDRISISALPRLCASR